MLKSLFGRFGTKHTPALKPPVTLKQYQCMQLTDSTWQIVKLHDQALASAQPLPVLKLLGVLEFVGKPFITAAECQEGCDLYNQIRGEESL
jgi:hypothetical protein